MNLSSAENDERRRQRMLNNKKNGDGTTGATNQRSQDNNSSIRRKRVNTSPPKLKTPVKRSNVASSNNNNNHIKVEDGSTPLDSIFNEIQAFDSVHKTHVNVKREAKLEKLKRLNRPPARTAATGSDEDNGGGPCSSKQLPPTPIPSSAHRPLTRVELARNDDDRQMLQSFLHKEGLMERILAYKMMRGRVEQCAVIEQVIELDDCVSPSYEPIDDSIVGEALKRERLAAADSGSQQYGAKPSSPKQMLLKKGQDDEDDDGVGHYACRQPPAATNHQRASLPNQRQQPKRGPKTPPGSPGAHHDNSDNSDGSSHHSRVSESGYSNDDMELARKRKNGGALPSNHLSRRPSQKSYDGYDMKNGGGVAAEEEDVHLPCTPLPPPPALPDFDALLPSSSNFGGNHRSISDSYDDHKTANRKQRQKQQDQPTYFDTTEDSSHQDHRQQQQSSQANELLRHMSLLTNTPVNQLSEYIGDDLHQAMNRLDKSILLSTLKNALKNVMDTRRNNGGGEGGGAAPSSSNGDNNRRAANTAGFSASSLEDNCSGGPRAGGGDTGAGGGCEMDISSDDNASNDNVHPTAASTLPPPPPRPEMSPPPPPPPPPLPPMIIPTTNLCRPPPILPTVNLSVPPPPVFNVSAAGISAPSAPMVTTFSFVNVPPPAVVSVPPPHPQVASEMDAPPPLPAPPTTADVVQHLPTVNLSNLVNNNSQMTHPPPLIPVNQPPPLLMKKPPPLLTGGPAVSSSTSSPSTSFENGGIRAYQSQQKPTVVVNLSAMLKNSNANRPSIPTVPVNRIPASPVPSPTTIPAAGSSTTTSSSMTVTHSGGGKRPRPRPAPTVNLEFIKSRPPPPIPEILRKSLPPPQQPALATGGTPIIAQSPSGGSITTNNSTGSLFDGVTARVYVGGTAPKTATPLTHPPPSVPNLSVPPPPLLAGNVGAPISTPPPPLLTPKFGVGGTAGSSAGSPMKLLPSSRVSHVSNSTPPAVPLAALFNSSNNRGDLSSSSSPPPKPPAAAAMNSPSGSGGGPSASPAAGLQLTNNEMNIFKTLMFALAPPSTGAPASAAPPQPQSLLSGVTPSSPARNRSRPPFYRHPAPPPSLGYRGVPPPSSQVQNQPQPDMLSNLVQILAKATSNLTSAATTSKFP